MRKLNLRFALITAMGIAASVLSLAIIPTLAISVEAQSIPSSRQMWFRHEVQQPTSRAQEMLDQKRYSEAVELLKSTDPGVPEILRSRFLVHALIEIGLLNDATAVIEKNLESNQDKGVMHFYNGEILSMRQEWGAAVNAFNRAIAEVPALAAAHSGLGRVFWNLGRTNESIASFKTALELDPDDLVAWSDLGSAYALAGRLDKAVDVYLNVLRKKPDFHIVRKNLALVYLTRKQQDKAIEQYAILKAKDSATAEALFMQIYGESILHVRKSN